MRTRGIVIDEMRHGETSKIITVFTRKLGVVSIMAKGAMLPGSSLLPLSHLFALSDLDLSTGAQFYYIKKGRILNTHFGLLNSYEKLIYGSFLMELIKKSLPVGDVNETLFDLLIKTLSILENTDRPRLISIGFSIKCISLLGYKPLIPDEISNISYNFSFEKGIFSAGESYLRNTFNLEGEEVKILYSILYSTLEEVEKFNIDEIKEIKLFKFVVQYIKYVLELDDFYSLKLLKGEDI